MSRSRVAVVGAGLVGASAALGLARLGYEVTLVERREPKPQRGRLGIDLRNVSLSVASKQFLHQLGVWSAQQLSPYRRMVVWEQWGTSCIEFDAAEINQTEMGWIQQLSPLTCNLWQACADCPGVRQVIDSIERLEVETDEVELHLANAGVHKFDFVIAADGANSALRRALNVDVITSPVEQVALATVVRTQLPHQQTAWQRFLVDGPLAYLPSKDPHTCSVVWSQSRGNAQARMALDHAALCHSISTGLEHRLGAVTDADTPVIIPLTQQRMSNCLPHARVLFVGDAARVVHPLAGLGVNLGFEDVVQMLEVARSQTDLAQQGIWRAYLRRRHARSQAMISTLDWFKRLYGQQGPGVSLLRNLGVQAFNAVPVIKQQIMREAMGLGPLSANPSNLKLSPRAPFSKDQNRDTEELKEHLNE